METEILEKWKILSNKIGAKVSFKESVQAHIDGYIIKPEIIKEINGGKITIKQTIMIYSKNNLQSTPLTINYKAKSINNLNFQIWKKGFMERVFNLGLKTGDELIDKKYYIKSSSKSYALALLSIPQFKAYLCTQKNFYFNIDTENDILTITFRVNEFKGVVNAYAVLKAIIDTRPK